MCIIKYKTMIYIPSKVLAQSYCTSDNDSNITSGSKRKNSIECYNKHPNTKIK